MGLTRTLPLPVSPLSCLLLVFSNFLSGDLKEFRGKAINWTPSIRARFKCYVKTQRYVGKISKEHGVPRHEQWMRSTNHCTSWSFGTRGTLNSLSSCLQS